MRHAYTFMLLLFYWYFVCGLYYQLLVLKFQVKQENMFPFNSILVIKVKYKMIQLKLLWGEYI